MQICNFLTRWGAASFLLWKAYETSKGLFWFSFSKNKYGIRSELSSSACSYFQALSSISMMVSSVFRDLSFLFRFFAELIGTFHSGISLEFSLRKRIEICVEYFQSIRYVRYVPPPTHPLAASAFLLGLSDLFLDCELFGLL